MRPLAGEKNHISGTLLETFGVCAEYEGGTLGAVADQADSGPDIDCRGEAITARWDEKDSLVRGFLDFINCLLQDGGIVGDTVGFHGEILGVK